MSKENIKNYFLEYLVSNNQPLKKIKSIDLAIIYIYRDKEEKPYGMSKRGKPEYYKYFYAIDKDGKKLHSVKAFDKNKGRILLEESINPKTKRYKSWESSGFSISYSGNFDDSESILIDSIAKDFPEIIDASRFFKNICNEFHNLLNTPK